nr:hypothetical protein [Tanacetum cinerariifolium]
MVLDNDGVASKTTKEKATFGISRENSFRNKGGEILKQKGACYNLRIEGHFSSECRKPKENKAFVGGAWSDSEYGDEPQNDATCLMAIESQEISESFSMTTSCTLRLPISSSRASDDKSSDSSIDLTFALYLECRALR